MGNIIIKPEEVKGPKGGSSLGPGTGIEYAKGWTAEVQKTGVKMKTGQLQNQGNKTQGQDIR